VPITQKNAALTKSIVRGEKINNAIRQFSTKDGTRIWASITTTPLKDGGKKVEGAILAIRDITKEKQQEEYRTDFAHVASHSLRTPLGNMMWAHEYILSGKAGELNDVQKDYLGESYRTLKTMNTMINDLLSVSRLPDRTIKPHFEKICLEKVIQQSIDNCNAFARARNVTIKNMSKKADCHHIKADPHYLPTIINNILENAIRYSFEKTEIILKIEQKNDKILWHCTNTGIGIPQDQQKFIFAKFYRSPNAIKKQGDGTGLGMYITKEMVILNKGEISFESVPDKKTTFHIKLNQY